MESRKRILSSKLLITGATGLLALLVVCVGFVLAPQATSAQPPDRPASAESAYAALAPALDLGNDPLTNTLCMGDVYALYGGGGSPNCTANDINLAQASVHIIEPCDFPGDTATISLTVEVNLTAQERHDIGAYLAIEGGDALYGTCNIYTLPYDPDPPWLDLDGTGDDGTFCGGDPYGQPCTSDDQCTAPETCDDVGPGIQDTCGDIDNDHNPLFLDAGVITVQCLDPDNDGWLDLPTCTSWRQPGANDLCTQPLNAFPGAPSKCRCEDIRLDVPVPPALYVDKVTDPSGDPTLFDFEVTGPTTDSFSLTDLDDPHLVEQPVSGTYAVTEAVPAAWELISATCTDGSPVDAIELSNGEIVTCTFTNRLMQGTLEVIKELDPTDDPGLFDLWIDSTKVYTDASHLDSSGPQTVISGTYTVSESAGTNTSLADYDTSYSCTGGSAPSGDGTSFSVDVPAGETVVCTFTNSRLPTLEVVKDLVPSDDGGRFNLLIDGTPYATDVGDGGTTGAQNVTAGLHTASETAGTDTTLTDYDTAYACTINGVAGPSGSGTSVDVNLGYGDNAVCTFTNSRLPTLEVVKDLVPPEDPGRFNLLIDGAPYATDVGDGGTTGAQNVTAGTHTASETAGTNTSLADYDTTYSCTGGSAPSGDGTSLSIDLTYGDTAVCTFTNEIAEGTLEVVKELDPTDDPGLFNLLIDGTEVVTDVGHLGSTGPQSVISGTHTASETAGTGTTLNDYDKTYLCTVNGVTGPSGSGTSVDVNVGPRDTVVCTFTNSRLPTLEVVKDLVPDTDDGRFNLYIDGTEYATDVGDGGTTGVHNVTAGSHAASEIAGTGTSLNDYDSTYVCTINGVTGPSGSGISVDVSLSYGDNAVCTFTNSRLATLEVIKELVPPEDPGLFNLLIDGTPYAANVGDGGTTGPQNVTAGTHTASETAGTDTSLTDYNTTYVCTVNGVTGPSGDGTSVDVNVAYGDTAVCTFTNTDIPSSIDVIKTADPTSVSECGEPVTYTVVVSNTSEVDLVTIDTLNDDVYGDLHGKGDCSVPQDIAAGGAYACSFTANVSGNPGASLTDVVTASGYDDDGYPVSDFDDATVSFFDELPDITVSKLSFPLMQLEPGGEWTYTVRVTNNVCEPVTLTSLEDTVYDPAGQYTVDITQVDYPRVVDTNCSLATIGAYGYYECTFTRYRTYDPIVIPDTVEAQASDDDGNSDIESDDAWIEIVGGLDIIVSKTASETEVSLGEPVTFTVKVTNDTLPAVSLTLDGLWDLVEGELEYTDLDGEGTCSLPQTIPPGGFYECTFTVIFDGPPIRTDTVWAHVSYSAFTGFATGSATVYCPECYEEFVYLPLVMKNW